MSVPRWALRFGLLLASAPFLYPAGIVAGIDPELHPDLQAGITLVQIPVNVNDASGHPVTNVDASKFRIFEDGVEQVVQSVSAEDAPVSVCILVDVSASMGGKRSLSREALQQFMGLANEDDRFCLIEFNERARLLMDFPSIATDVQTRANWERTGGQTALLDAVYAGLAEMRHVHGRRKALLIVSDGGDNRSRYTETEIRSAVREADVQIYAMGVVDPVYTRKSIPELERGPDLLREISEETGGRAYLVDRRGDLSDAARKIGLALRNQYVISYKAPAENRDGKYHKVVVKAVSDDAEQLRLSWRRGYYSPAD